MPTKNKISSAEINFLQLLPGMRLTRAGIVQTFRYWHKKIRYGGVSPKRRWAKLFDTSVTDLSTLPIGFFDSKACVLPRSMLPTTWIGLRKLCRQLVDRNEDESHIALMTKGWLGGLTLEDHVDALWALREPRRRLYEDIVRGRHGRALARIKTEEHYGQHVQPDAVELVYRQGMFLCAMDVQVVIARCRQSFIRPLGPLISTAMKVVKGGTALRLMKKTLDGLGVATADYQTEAEEAIAGPNKAKPKGKVAKTIAYHAEKQISSGPRLISDYRHDLDDSIPDLRSAIPTLNQRLPTYLTAMTERLAQQETKDGTFARRSNTLRHFHPIWYSDLSAAGGMAVAQFRYVQAEQLLASMIEAAANTAHGGRLMQVDPLPALPTDPKELAAIYDRVVNLSHSARRVQLRDRDWQSGARGKAGSIEAALRADPSLIDRNPVDRAGVVFVTDALKFLKAAGMRPRDAHIRKPGEDESVLTYWHMDVIPEFRLSF